MVSGNSFGFRKPTPLSSSSLTKSAKSRRDLLSHSSVVTIRTFPFRQRSKVSHKSPCSPFLPRHAATPAFASSRHSHILNLRAYIVSKTAQTSSTGIYQSGRGFGTRGQILETPYGDSRDQSLYRAVLRKDRRGGWGEASPMERWYRISAHRQHLISPVTPARSPDESSPGVFGDQLERLEFPILVAPPERPELTLYVGFTRLAYKQLCLARIPRRENRNVCTVGFEPLPRGKVKPLTPDLPS